MPTIIEAMTTTEEVAYRVDFDKKYHSFVGVIF